MRKLFGSLALAAAFYFLLPLFAGVLHIGMTVPALVLLILAVWCFCGRHFPRRLRCTLAVLYTLIAVIAGLFLFSMSRAAHNPPIPENGDGTVIVLGCEVVGEAPGLMLQNRVDAAYAYLTAHPEAVCICSGGMADDEIITEARCIAEALTEMGIDPARLYREEFSCSTEENLRYSAQIIAENHLSPIVIIATDNFHECRAALYARRSGLTPFAIGCRSPWYFSGSYWCREMAAISAAYVLRG